MSYFTYTDIKNLSKKKKKKKKEVLNFFKSLYQEVTFCQVIQLMFFSPLTSSEIKSLCTTFTNGCYNELAEEFSNVLASCDGFISSFV